MAGRASSKPGARAVLAGLTMLMLVASAAGQSFTKPPPLDDALDELDDPEEPAKAVDLSVEPVDTANSVYFGRAEADIRTEPGGKGEAVARLKRGQQINVTGRTRNSDDPAERWYRVAYADGTPRFVEGKALLSAKRFEEARSLRSRGQQYRNALAQVGNSTGKLARYMGHYSLGKECKLAPHQVPKVSGFERAQVSSQGVQDVFWQQTQFAFWTDGASVHAVRPFHADKPSRFTPTFVRILKTSELGTLQVYRLQRVDPPGVDPDLALVGFGEGGKMAIALQLDGNKYRHRFGTRCEGVERVGAAVVKAMDEMGDRLPIE